MMIRDMSGTRLINPRYINEIWVASDRDGVMKRILADVQGGGVVLLRQVNTYEVAGAEAYIARQFEFIEEAMNNA